MAVYTDEAALKTFLGSDLVDALGGLQGSVASSVIAAAIQDASTEIDSALSAMYLVPFADYSTGDTPAIVTLLCNTISAANLFAKRYPESPVHKRLVEKADAILSRLLAGEYTIPTGASEQDAEDASAGVAWSGDGATFADGGMAKW